VPTKKAKRRKRERERERERERKGEQRIVGVTSWSDGDGSVRGDKQSLGRIPLGTKLCSLSIYIYLVELTHYVSFIQRHSLVHFSHFLEHARLILSTLSSLSPSLLFFLFRMSNTDSACENSIVSLCDSPCDVYRDALSYYLA